MWNHSTFLAEVACFHPSRYSLVPSRNILVPDRANCKLQIILSIFSQPAMSRSNFLFTTCLFIPACVTCFCIISTSPIRLQHASKLYSNRFDFEKNAERRALENGVSGGTGETIAGAVLGGLVLGPFGTLITTILPWFSYQILWIIF